MEREILQDLLESHRILCHDIMNHYQVILGYLQIGRPEKAQEYINTSAQSFKRFSLLKSVQLPVMKAFLTSFITSFPSGVFGFEVHAVPEKSWEKWREDDAQLTVLLKTILTALREDIIAQTVKCRIEFFAANSGVIRIVIKGDADSCAEAAGRLAKLNKEWDVYSINLRTVTPGELDIQIGKKD